MPSRIILEARIRVLRDTNEDGVMDESSIFAADIPFPTGVTVWRDGVLVCAAPSILYLPDADHDDRADRVEVLATGFGTENYQGRVNSLEYGLDGWVYGFLWSLRRVPYSMTMTKYSSN